MSKRLQVLVEDREFAELHRAAKLEGLSVGEWVRRTLRQARAARSAVDPNVKLRAIREAAAYSFPTADIDRMLAEIEHGYHD